MLLKFDLIKILPFSRIKMKLFPSKLYNRKFCSSKSKHEIFVWCWDNRDARLIYAPILLYLRLVEIDD